MKKKFLLLSLLCLILAVCSAAAEDAAEVRTHNFVFRADADWTWEKTWESASITEHRIDTGDYKIRAIMFTYPVTERAVIEKPGTHTSVQINNYMYMLRKYLVDIMDIRDFNSWEEDIGMPNGQKVVIGHVSRGDHCEAICTQYVEGQAFCYLLTAKDNDYRRAQDFLQEIALTTQILEEAGIRLTITADTARIRAEASVNGKLLCTAYKGDIFVYMGQEGDFYLVEVDGKLGYVHKGVTDLE